MNSIYIVRIIFVNEWNLADCSHHKFKVSTQIMVCDYLIVKYKTFFAWNGLLMALWAIFFMIQNIYFDSSPDIHIYVRQIFSPYGKKKKLNCTLRLLHNIVSIQFLV